MGLDYWRPLPEGQPSLPQIDLQNSILSTMFEDSAMLGLLSGKGSRCLNVKEKLIGLYVGRIAENGSTYFKILPSVIPWLPDTSIRRRISEEASNPSDTI